MEIFRSDWKFLYYIRKIQLIKIISLIALIFVKRYRGIVFHGHLMKTNIFNKFVTKDFLESFYSHTKVNFVFLFELFRTKLAMRTTK